MVRSRKLEAAILGMKLGALLLVAVGCLSVFHIVTDAMEDRDRYLALFQIEQQSTDILINQQMKRMSTLGLGVIDIEIPCDAERGLVHRVQLEISK